jgi:hypothetical protein
VVAKRKEGQGAWWSLEVRRARVVVRSSGPLLPAKLNAGARKFPTKLRALTLFSLHNNELLVSQLHPSFLSRFYMMTIRVAPIINYMLIRPPKAKRDN